MPRRRRLAGRRPFVSSGVSARPSPLEVSCVTSLTDPPAVPAPACCSTSAWDPARVIRAYRTRAMFVCRVLVAR
eukprot:4844782-Prymnesium_polylepis.1